MRNRDKGRNERDAKTLQTTSFSCEHGEALCINFWKNSVDPLRKNEAPGLERTSPSTKSLEFEVKKREGQNQIL